MFVQYFTLIKMCEAFDEDLETRVDTLDVLGPYEISSEHDQSRVSSASNVVLTMQASQLVHICQHLCEGK
jgi:hypothetical protein